MRDIIIGIDAGTSVIKSVAFDLHGQQIAIHAITNRYQTIDGAGAEQDMAQTWTDTVNTLKGLADSVDDLAARTAAIAVTGQGDGTWLIDAAGEPVAPAWLWLDARAAALVDDFRGNPADLVRFTHTATGLAACQQGAQMIWMKRHAPQLLTGSDTAMHCKDWLYFNLTGERATDPSEACFTFGDVRQRRYSDEVIGALGLDDQRHLLPPIIDGTQTVHALTPAAAKACGLLQGTPVVLGYVDVACTALGAGLYAEDGTPGCTIVGSTGMHMRLVRSTDEIVLNDARTGYTMTMPIPGVYAQMQSNMASTLNIDWLLDLAGDLLGNQGVKRERAELIAQLDGWVAGSQPASLLYQPYVSEAGERGPFIDGNARAGFIGLATRHRFNDLVRAVVEGLAFAARDCYRAMGPLPEEVRLTGGAVRSSTLRQIFATVLGARIRTSAREEAGAAGAAMMAAVAIDHYETMDACVAEWVSPLLGDAQAPDAELTGVYDRAYPAYVGAHQALRPIWAMLARSKSATT